jgi:hypothetical protein
VPVTVADRSSAERRRRQVLTVLALWLGSRIVLLFLALNPGLYSGAILGDVIGYGAKVERMFQGELPYREVAIEYPPGSLPFTLLPALIVGTGPGYRLAFALTMLAVDAVGLAGAFALGRSLDQGRVRVPVAYVLGTFLAGPLLFVRFDIVPGLCVLLAALFAVRRRPGLAAAALGYGTAAKLFPVVLAPLLVLGLVPAIGWLRSFARTVPAFLVGFALTAVPALAISFSGTISSVIGYHTKRGVQIESLWANGIEILHVLFKVPAREQYEYGAFDLASGLSGTAKTLSGVATVVLLAFAALVTWRRAGGWPFGRRPAGLRGADWPLVLALGVFAFMLPTRVLSPQYLFWLVVLCAAAALPLGRGVRTAVALWCLSGPITQLIFPFRYNALRHLAPAEVGLLTVRNGLLVAAAVVLVRVLWTAPEPAAGGAGRGNGLVSTRPDPDPDGAGSERGRERESRSTADRDSAGAARDRHPSSDPPGKGPVGVAAGPDHNPTSSADVPGPGEPDPAA